MIYAIGMLLGFGVGSFCGVVLNIEWAAALGLILFTYCWIRLEIMLARRQQ